MSIILITAIIKQSYKLFLIRKKFPGRIIHSSDIANDVVLGNYCAIGKNVSINDHVQLGDFSYVNGNTMIGKNTKIGKYCSISYGCQIGLSSHPINFISTHPALYGKNQSKNIFNLDYIDSMQTNIGNDVWIGGNAIILNGVTIGNGAIIGAGAVVTKDVPAYSIVGGIPSKVIRKRFNDKEIEYLQKISWWDLPEEELLKYRNLFESGVEWTNSIITK